MDQAKRNLLIGGSVIAAITIAGMLPGMCAMKQSRRKPVNPVSNPPPKRPPGQPKPMLEEDIAPVLARLDAWYAAHLPSDQYKFNPPASEAELNAFERLIGIKLPKSYRQLYGCIMVTMLKGGPLRATSTALFYCRYLGQRMSGRSGTACSPILSKAIAMRFPGQDGL